MRDHSTIIFVLHIGHLHGDTLLMTSKRSDRKTCGAVCRLFGDIHACLLHSVFSTLSGNGVCLLHAALETLTLQNVAGLREQLLSVWLTELK